MITPQDIEGRLQRRSSVWDKGIFGGGWWAPGRHEWEGVLGKKVRVNDGAKSAARHKAEGAVKGNTGSRWVWGNRIRRDCVPVLIPLTRIDSCLRIWYLSDSLNSALKRSRKKSQFWNTWFHIFQNRTWICWWNEELTAPRMHEEILQKLQVVCPLPSCPWEPWASFAQVL